ncbi:MAG: DUF2927 domain-containing protein [Planctomycetota bacterium]
MHRIQRASLTLLLLLLVASSRAHAESVDQLVDAFVEITDKAELKVEKHGRLAGITKWTSPIEYSVVGATSPKLVREVETQMAHLAQLSGLQIRRVGAFALTKDGLRQPIEDVRPLSEKFEFATMREDVARLGHTINIVADRSGSDPTVWMGNLTIMFGKRHLLERVFNHLLFDRSAHAAFADGRAACFTALTIREGTMEPLVAVVLIPTEHDAVLTRRCLVEETTQALGLVNDIPGSTLTLFDDRPDHRRTELTAYDEMFLRVLYNPEIKLGMTGRELRKTARRLIEVELSKTR